MPGERARAAHRRVVIADDDYLLREGLASLLRESGIEVVGLAGDGSELVELVRERRPDLAIVDIRMPPTHTTEGLDAAALIRGEFPETAILVLSAHIDVTHAIALIGGGRGSGYLLKSRIDDLDEFVEDLERLCRGGSVIDPALVEELVGARRANDPLEDLTSREREVLAFMAEGRSNGGIARLLWVTEGTIERHIHNILAKLRLPETADDHRRVLAVITYLNAH
jgi:DNA-binding NarL/FixJ family response regulator